MNYATLTAELAQAHPVSGAYDVDAQLAADQMNALDISRIKSSMTGAEIWAATDAGQYTLLSDTKKSQWLAFCAINEHNPEVDGLAQLFVVDVFTSGATVSNLNTLRSETISRATEIANELQYSGLITSSHVKKARGEI